jgi:exodeoxyribonuclease V alpha subunit
VTDIILDASQERAVKLVCTARVGIVTGGPGTGKSTCLRVALDRLDRAHVRYELASPTGKAARRLTEATSGRNARTLHRLLEYNPGRGGFQRHTANPLDCDVVIVDEASMIDTQLFAALMRAVAPHRTRVILVGDANQLPPVGPGRPFGDLVDWKRVPTARLEVLHRAAQSSWVHVAAQDLLQGREPALEARADFRWVECNDPRWILPKLRRLMTEVFGPGGKIADEVQVLIPQRPGLAGIDAANVDLQTVLNPKREGEPVWARNLWEIRKDDTVIQTRNDYDLAVFNGEIGKVLHVGELRDRDGQPRLGADDKPLEGVIVQFGGHDELSEYVGPAVNALQLAYALTIHRSQGSEFAWVIVVCHSCHAFILSRQLLYTAITRAKRGVVLIGDRKGLERALANRRTDERNTTLVARLDDTLEPVELWTPLLDAAISGGDDAPPTIH